MRYNRAWLAVFLLLQSLDVATTFIGLRAGLYEANALAAWLGLKLGTWALYGWKGFAVSLFLLLLLLLQTRYPQVWLAVRLSAAVLLVAVSFNVLNLALEMPRLLA